MSKLSHHLKLEPTQQLVKAPQSFQFLNIKESLIPTEISTDQVYKFRSEFYCQVNLSTQHKQEELARAKVIAREQLIESVFGEFRKPLLDLKLAVWNGERERALELIESIQNEMFS